MSSRSNCSLIGFFLMKFLFGGHDVTHMYPYNGPCSPIYFFKFYLMPLYFNIPPHSGKSDLSRVYSILNRNWPEPEENHKKQQYDFINPLVGKLWHKVSDLPKITKVGTRI